MWRTVPRLSSIPINGSRLEALQPVQLLTRQFREQRSRIVTTRSTPNRDTVLLEGLGYARSNSLGERPCKVAPACARGLPERMLTGTARGLVDVQDDKWWLSGHRMVPVASNTRAVSPLRDGDTGASAVQP